MQPSRMPIKLFLSIAVLAAPLSLLCAQAIPPAIGGLRYARTLGDTESFGQVAAAVVLPGGHVAILDGMERRVTLFGRTGSLMGRYDRRGRGPGEFSLPSALAVRGGSVLVLDRGNARIVELSVVADTLAWRGEIRTPISSPNDMCTVGDRLFLLGFEGGKLIHEVDRNGKIARSFGAAAGDDPTKGHLSAVGSLVCSPSGWIAVLAGALNHVMVYSLEGQERWKGRIPDYRRQEYDTGGGVLRPLRPSGGYSNTIASARASDGRFLDFQLGRSSAKAPGVALESRRLDITTGSWLPVAMKWPRLLTISDGSHLFYEENPFPIVKVYR